MGNPVRGIRDSEIVLLLLLGHYNQQLRCDNIQLSDEMVYQCSNFLNRSPSLFQVHVFLLRIHPLAFNLDVFCI